MINSKFLLHDYQLECIKKIKKTKKCALHLDMGCGKTVIALSAIFELLQEKKIDRILIVAPLQVAKNVWHNEIQRWEHLKDITYKICVGSKVQREKALLEEAKIYIVNRDVLADVQGWISKKKIKKFDMLILDESSSFKNSSTKRYKAARKIDCEYLVELTGTPSPNGLLDLHAQIALIDKGIRLGKYKNHFIKNFFDYKVNRYGGFFYDCRAKNPDEIYEKISDIVFSLKASDYISLPSRKDLVTRVELSNFKQYKQLEKDYILTLKDEVLLAQSKIVLYTKLLQFCNGAIYDENKKIIEVNSDKLEALQDIIENNRNENFLIAYNFQSDLLRIQSRFCDAVVLTSENSEAVLQAWNRGKIKMLLAHPASASMGLNLQKGGSVIIWYSMTWNLEHYLQFNARLHRQGQERAVKIMHLLAKDTIDETIYEALKAKKDVQSALIDSLLLNVKRN